MPGHDELREMRLPLPWRNLDQLGKLFLGQRGGGELEQDRILRDLITMQVFRRGPEGAWPLEAVVLRDGATIRNWATIGKLDALASAGGVVAIYGRAGGLERGEEIQVLARGEFLVERSVDTYPPDDPTDLCLVFW